MTAPAMTKGQTAPVEEIARMLGRAPTPEERAIHADQARRLAAIWDHPLAEQKAGGLSPQPPFGGATET